ncbi:MAG TPA: DNA polymerase III subunit chi, partial [Alphaproteobacteria bacterium]|nr:DNA polymerase III subunit chi [Alphaproteobacteria bacterium]
GYERVVYIFSGHDPEAVAEARVAWRALSTPDNAVTYWQQDASGRWVKQA